MAKKRLETEDVGHVTVVRFVDEELLDERNVAEIGAQLAALTGAFVLIDFEGVTFFSSSMIQHLERLRDRCEASSGKLVLTRASAVVNEVFRLTQLGGGFTFAKNRKTGLRKF